MADFPRAALFTFGLRFGLGIAFGLVSLTAGWARAAELPARYYRLMEAGCSSIAQHPDRHPSLQTPPSGIGRKKSILSSRQAIVGEVRQMRPGASISRVAVS